MGTEAGRAVLCFLCDSFAGDARYDFFPLRAKPPFRLKIIYIIYIPLFFFLCMIATPISKNFKKKGAFSLALFFSVVLTSFFLPLHNFGKNYSCRPRTPLSSISHPKIRLHSSRLLHCHLFGPLLQPPSSSLVPRLHMDGGALSYSA